MQSNYVVFLDRPETNRKKNNSKFVPDFDKPFRDPCSKNIRALKLHFIFIADGRNSRDQKEKK